MEKCQILEIWKIGNIAPFRDSAQFNRLTIWCCKLSDLSLIQVLSTRNTTRKASGRFGRFIYINNILKFRNILRPPLDLRGGFETLQIHRKTFFSEDFEELNISAILYVSNFFPSQNLLNWGFLSWAKIFFPQNPLLMQNIWKSWIYQIFLPELANFQFLSSSPSPKLKALQKTTFSCNFQPVLWKPKIFSIICWNFDLKVAEHVMIGKSHGICLKKEMML